MAIHCNRRVGVRQIHFTRHFSHALSHTIRCAYHTAWLKTSHPTCLCARFIPSSCHPWCVLECSLSVSLCLSFSCFSPSLTSSLPHSTCTVTSISSPKSTASREYCAFAQWGVLHHGEKPSSHTHLSETRHTWHKNSTETTEIFLAMSQDLPEHVVEGQRNYKTIKDEFEEENMICDGAKVINKAKQDKIHRRNRKKNKKRQRKKYGTCPSQTELRRRTSWMTGKVLAPAIQHGWRRQFEHMGDDVGNVREPWALREKHVVILRVSLVRVRINEDGGRRWNSQNPWRRSTPETIHFN